MKHLLLILCAALIGFQGNAENQKDPSHWRVIATKLDKSTYRVEFHVDIDKGWHIWTLNPGGDGSLIPPSFHFNTGKYTLVEGLGEQGISVQAVLGGIKDPAYFYPSGAMFTQSISAKKGTVITGTYTYQLCSNTLCMAPKTKPFKVKLP
ncbi:MAG: protein-disulfide reductase DsbD domain-containing protein [Chitinophagaceae bacterium]